MESNTRCVHQCFINILCTDNVHSSIAIVSMPSGKITDKYGDLIRRYYIVSKRTEWKGQKEMVKFIFIRRCHGR